MKALPFIVSLLVSAAIGAAIWFVRSAKTQSLDQRLTELKSEIAARSGGPAPLDKAAAAAAAAKRAGRKESAFGAIFDPVDRILATPDDQVADLAQEMFKKRPGENLVNILKLMAIYSRWAEVDPEGALKFILENTNGGKIRDERGVALAGLFSTWMARDSKGAFASISTLKDGDLKKGMMEFMPRYLAFMRPDLSEGWDTAMTTAGVEQKQMEDLQAIKAARDPETALKELDSITDPAERAKKAEAIIGALAISNPARALEVAPKLLADANLRGGEKWMLTAAMSNVAAKDPDKALEQYMKAPDGLKEAYKGSFSAFGNLEPDQIREKSNKFSTPAEKKEFMNGAIAGKASSDPVEAANMLSQMPPGEQNPQTLMSIGREYSNKDFNAAQKWITDLPPGANRDSAIVGSLDEVSKENRAQAAELIPQIGDKKQQDVQAQNFARTWINQDKTAATEWINNTPLFSQEQRNNILNPKPGQPGEIGF